MWRVWATALGVLAGRGVRSRQVGADGVAVEDHRQGHRRPPRPAALAAYGLTLPISERGGAATSTGHAPGDGRCGDAWDAAAGYVSRRPAASRPASTSTTAATRSGRSSRSTSPGSSSSEVSIEVSGRHLVIGGERPVQETEGRVYQQVEIPSGPFRRVVELHVDVDAERGQGHLRGRGPADRAAAARPRRDHPPGADRARVMEGGPVLEVVESPLDAEDAIRANAAAAGRAAGAAAARHGHLPGHADPAGGRPGALDPAGQRRPLRQPDAGHGRLARPRERGARARRPLRRRRRRRRRPHAQGPRRHAPHPRPGHPAGPARRLRRRGALPGRADRRAARRDRADPRAGGADPQRPAHLLGDHRADPLPARGAAAGGRQHRRPVGARPPDRRRAADLDRGEAGAARGGRRRQAAAPPLADPRPRARGGPARHQDPVPGPVGDRQGPARVLPAPAAQGDPGGARRGRRAAGRDQRAARADRGGRAARARAQSRRARARPAGEAAARGRRVRRHPHLPGVAGRAALDERDRGQPRHQARPRGPRRRPLRPREGQGPDPRVPGGAQAQPRLARARSSASSARPGSARPASAARSPRRWAASSSGSRSAASATRPRSAATAAPTSARCPARSSAPCATPAPATRSS